MGRIIGLIVWVIGIIVFYAVYFDSVLVKFGLVNTTESRVVGMLVFAGVWAVVVNTILYLLPTSWQAKLR